MNGRFNLSSFPLSLLPFIYFSLFAFYVMLLSPEGSHVMELYLYLYKWAKHKRLKSSSTTETKPKQYYSYHLIASSFPKKWCNGALFVFFKRGCNTSSPLNNTVFVLFINVLDMCVCVCVCAHASVCACQCWCVCVLAIQDVPNTRSQDNFLWKKKKLIKHVIGLWNLIFDPLCLHT